MKDPVLTSSPFPPAADLLRRIENPRFVASEPIRTVRYKRTVTCPFCGKEYKATKRTYCPKCDVRFG